MSSKIIIPQHILGIKKYVPGRQIEDAIAEFGLTRVIKLASNENNLGPSPKAVEAMREAFIGLARYGDPDAKALKNAIGEKTNFPSENILCGNGSSELILLLCQVFLEPGLNAIMSRPSFTLYAKLAAANGAEAREVALKNHAHDLKRLAELIDPQTRLIFLDNPLNPTGAFLNAKDIHDFVSSLPETVLLVLDEAYVDFAREGRPDYAKLIATEQVVILRTFSKLYGLAGIRAGYAILSKYLAEAINKIRQPFNLNNFAQVGVLAAFDDQEHVNKTLAMTQEGLKFLKSELEVLGLKTYPTQANFLMADTAPLLADYFVQELFKKGLIIRSLSSFGMPDKVRITAGLQNENALLIEGIKKILNS
ncbi:MAG: histidinol-phosphate transaminase [Deltaproteobacteria bacterium]|jgi:histidinol-phosphate aminotransferase|nr:histidinol-phosphate transaminase [Deltaproteobacteria bacterium]